MTAGLRDVLRAFETAPAPQTLSQMARALDLTPAMLQELIDFWVRKGRLRAVHLDSACGTCGGADGCPFILKLPPTYELVAPGTAETPSAPACRGCR